VAPEVGTAVPTLAEVERLGGISMQLDIAVERRRSFWWRLVAKLQFSAHRNVLAPAKALSLHLARADSEEVSHFQLFHGISWWARTE
jgi:hypothetical protein